MLIVMNKSTPEEHLYQSLQTNNAQFKKAVTFLTGYNGVFNVLISNNKFSFMKSTTDKDGFIKITKLPGAFELVSLNSEIKRIIIDKGHYSEKEYPFTIRPNFSTLGSIIEMSPQGLMINFLFDDSIGDLLGFHAITLYEEYIISPNPVDILSFDNIFNHTNVAQGMIFKGKRSGKYFNFTMHVDLGYKYFGKFRGGVQWYMMESKDFISSINFKKMNNENGNLVSFKGQSRTFGLSINEI